MNTARSIIGGTIIGVSAALGGTHVIPLILACVIVCVGIAIASAK